MYQVFKALSRAPRVRKDVYTLRRLQCTHKHRDCSAHLWTSSTIGALTWPGVRYECLTQGSKAALLRHQTPLHCVTLHSSAALRASSIVSFPLAQTGEGIKECELTEWYVEVRCTG